MDGGHELTEEIIKEIEDRCREEYEVAAREMRKKYREYMAQFEEERKVQHQLWKEGKISKKDYTDFVYRKTMVGKRWEAMADTLARDLTHTDEIARAIAEGRAPDIFALNMNYTTWHIEHYGRIDTGFTLYNADTAAYVMQEENLMPGPSPRKAAEIARNKDMAWNKKHIQSAVLQGVLQGESPYDVAKRLTGVAQMGYNSAVRYARTMSTNAQNAGRYEAFHRATRHGVDLTIEWQATLDGRTRHEHRMLHGKRTTVDKPFVVEGIEILWPAQSSGPGSSDIPQEMIWNCRCTLLGWVKGFEGETVKSSPKMGNMSFEEWQEAKPMPDSKADRKQFEEYKKLLGKNAPKYFSDFQDIKYNDPEKWAALKEAAKAKRLGKTAGVQPKPAAKTPSAKKKQTKLDESQTIKDLRNSKIKRNEPPKFKTIPTEEEIIKRVAGGDETKGSCVSLAYAYAGNKAGFEVNDFRGGESQSFFSSWYGHRELVNRLGIKESAKTEVAAATKLLDRTKEGKEYILIAGKHAAVVRRKAEGGYEYLELQDIEGGWYSFGANTLRRRFGCRVTPKKNLLTGKNRDSDCYMIDIQDLKKDSVFQEMLCYIHTDYDKRKAGKYGYAK